MPRFQTICYFLILSLLLLQPLRADEVLMKGAAQAVQRGQYQMALKIYQKALEKGANKAVVYYNLGNVYYRQGNIPQAIEHYQKTIALAPYFKNAYLNMAKINYSYEEYHSAIEIVKNYLALNPYDVESLVLLAAMYRKVRGFVLAEKNLQRAQQIDPYYEDLYFEYADLFYELGDLDRALRYIKQGVNALPTSLYLKEQEARFHTEKKEYQTAANIYLSLLRQFTNLEAQQAYFYRCDIADCFLLSQLTNSAIIQLKEAIWLYPAGENAFYLLNGVYLDTGRVLEAIEFYRETFPKNPGIVRGLIRDVFTLAFNQNNKIYLQQFVKLYEELGLVDELYRHVKDSS